jgi:hypothetical protein
MRIMLIIPVLALVGACDVTKDSANNTVSLTVNQEEAGNDINNAGNTIQNIAQDVGNEAQNLGEKVKNTDVDVNANTDVKTENKSK